VGLSCDGYEGKLSALFADIIANNEEKGVVSVSTVEKKGMRKLNLFSSINNDLHSGRVSRNSIKGEGS
jgi:hypothetical protein